MREPDTVKYRATFLTNGHARAGYVALGTAENMGQLSAGSESKKTLELVYDNPSLEPGTISLSGNGAVRQMIIVDFSIWIDYFNGKITPQTDWLDSSLGNTPIIAGDIILAEVLQGFQNDKDFRVAKDLLWGMPFMAMGGRIFHG